MFLKYFLIMSLCGAQEAGGRRGREKTSCLDLWIPCKSQVLFPRLSRGMTEERAGITTGTN